MLAPIMAGGCRLLRRHSPHFAGAVSVAKAWLSSGMFEEGGSMLAFKAVGTESQEKRRMLRSDAACKFVEPYEFFRLVISNRKLMRCDEAVANVRGVFDPAQGIRFVVEEEKLANYDPPSFVGQRPR